MSRVCVFLADGFEEIEGLTVVDLLRRAEIETTTISITDKLLITGAHDILVQADKLFHDVNFDEVEMFVLPGGMPGTTNLMSYEPLIQLLKHASKEKKYIAAICAAPSILGQNDLLHDKNVTSYPTVVDKLLGANYTGATVEVDGNIITSKGMGTSIDFSLELISILKDKELASSIAISIQYA